MNIYERVIDDIAATKKNEDGKEVPDFEKRIRAIKKFLLLTGQTINSVGIANIQSTDDKPDTA